MRTASRAFFINAVTWQLDEERAALIPALLELTEATSFYDATAYKVGADWILCWWGRVDPDGEFWFQVCRRVGDPGPAWVTLPCCPEHEIPTTLTGWFEIAPPYLDCDTIEDRPFRFYWNGDVEPYGRWVGELDIPGDDPLVVVITPTTGCGPLGQGWTVEVFWHDKDVFHQEYSYSCGELPTGWTMFQNDNGPCPGTASLFFLEP